MGLLMHNRAIEYPRENDCACYQMRLQCDPLAKVLCFLPGVDCSIAGALGLLRILIYKVYNNGTTSKMTFERKASLREFYGYIFPYLLQLGDGLTNMKCAKLRIAESKNTKNHKRSEMDEPDFDSDKECDICMETNEKMLLPDCTHGLCIKCYSEWSERSQSCPFCRGNLKAVNSMDLWVMIDADGVKDAITLSRQDVLRLFHYIDNLPVATPDKVLKAGDNVVEDCRVHFTADPFGCHLYASQGNDYKLRVTADPYGYRFSYYF